MSSSTWCIFCVGVAVTLLLRGVKAQTEDAPRLKEIVYDLQQQILELQVEQRQNRAFIRTLESKIDEETSQRRSRSRRNRNSNANAEWKEPEDVVRSQEVQSSMPVEEKLLLAQLSMDTFTQGEKPQSSANNTKSQGETETVWKLKKPAEEPPKIEEWIGEMRSEWESLKLEVQKLRQAVSEERAKGEEQQEQLGQMQSSHITVKWMQRSVEDVRREMAELAAALNISMALRQRQQLEAELHRLRTDLVTLRTGVEYGQAERAREAAALRQLKEELAEVRLLAQTASYEHQHLGEEVSTMKEELLSSFFPDFSQVAKSGEHQTEDDELLEGSGDEDLPELTRLFSGGVHSRHHQEQHFHREFHGLKERMGRFEKSQTLMERDLRSLKHNFSSTQASVHNMERTTRQLENQTGWWIEENSSLLSALDLVREQMNIVEEKATQNGNNIVNITEAVTGMDKVHSSTVQLFEALEAIEEEYSKNIRELQKEVSKFEFNVAQVQSSFDILRHDQSSHYQEVKTLKGDLSILQTEVQKNHYRLVTVQNDVLNHSLHRCSEDNKETLQDLKLSNLELRLSKLSKRSDENKQQIEYVYGKVMNKADQKSLVGLEGMNSQVKNEMNNISEQISHLESRERHMKNELMKFVHQLPKDCSMADLPNPSSVYRSGIYLIHVPHTHQAREVFCDFETEKKRWTMIQRRIDGTEDFFRNWTDYRDGFGRMDGEFWLGNEDIHKLTHSKNYTLRIDMWDAYGDYTYAEYKEFRVANENDLYRLTVGQYRGNSSDALRHHHQMAFSTRDRDNDASSSHCAMYYSGGWWYEHCQYVNVNGRYALGMTWYDDERHKWVQLSRVEMKIEVTDDS